MNCLLLLPAGTEWLITAPLVFLFCYIIYKSICKLFK